MSRPNIRRHIPRQRRGRFSNSPEPDAFSCRSGLVSRKGRNAAPAIYPLKLKTWGRFAPLSRHKAAPTKARQYLRRNFLDTHQERPWLAQAQ
ncbi:hypothetical protein CXG50_20595 [Pseudomonas plecoglossicida]|uniref:Uncharacterized protein n=1 Tax=Pseudomonas plecoglossicida TaxID=70775 RepID=A0ABX4U603_PSEDL|nr:hypothetical protein CSW00_23605 [Pseudomonas sp. MR 02]PLP90665.1 hypothetical protein CX682_13855 [Pseudomonas sp. FFUP_PS_41]PLU84929.1 hypothetical protein CXG44_23745 [Pseudomonas plecoglossicida]TXI06498.1 MAG: hypothetical protein E6Q70_08090 [Pseudomonas monteilii]PLU94006.1 hypothetical protein CXG45_07470 [Pseudomonas plecoglossicida]